MMLSPAAVEALKWHGTEEQRQTWMPKLVTGEWNGTMNLTEPQAGSDVGALKTRAVPQGDGSYRSEEHTSELQSLMRTSYAVFCLKNKKYRITHTRHTPNIYHT